MALRRSYTAVVERNALWQGEFATEPYEAAWASEAIFFVRALADAGNPPLGRWRPGPRANFGRRHSLG